MPQVGSPHKAGMAVIFPVGAVVLLPRVILQPAVLRSVCQWRQHAAGVGFALLALVGGLIRCLASIATRSGKLHLAEPDFTREETS